MLPMLRVGLSIPSGFSHQSRKNFLLLVPLVMIVLAQPALAAWEHGDWTVVFEDPISIMGVGAWPDGQGGMFVAGVKQDPMAYARIMLSRLDNTGTELWGDGGIFLPVDLLASSDWTPIDVVADGLGGAYIAFARHYATPLYMVAHYEGDGSLDWTVPVDQKPIGTPFVGVQVVPGAYGGVYVVYLSADTSGNENIKCVHFDTEGAVLGSTDVTSAATATSTYFEATTDQAGGFLVAWTRTIGAFPEIGVQRVNSSTARVWGNDGVLVWATAGHGDKTLAPDGQGGAYLVVCGVGRALGQHLDAAGTKLWPVGGKILHDTNTAYTSKSSYPNICPDGQGGLFLIHGIENVFVQRVDASGGFPWGIAGVQIASGVDLLPQVGQIVQDGFGGAVFRYNTYYDLGTAPLKCRQIQGGRINGSGLILWDEYLWSCEYSGGSASPVVEIEPRRTTVIADGTGGASFVWSDYHPLDATSGEILAVLATGRDENGNLSAPTLKEMHPGSGQPGELPTVGIFGNYLSASQDFKLQLAGKPDLPVTGLVQHSATYLQGSLDLTGAPGGIYDLVLSVGGSPVSTLHGAYGVGYPVLCVPDQPFGPNAATPLTAGSKRKTVFTADGSIHMAWIETVAGLNKLFYWNDTMGPAVGDEIFQSYDTIREISLDVGPDDIWHLVLVVDDVAGDYLHHIFSDGSGHRDGRMILIPGGVHNPSVACMGPNAEIVFEGDIGSETWLFHIQGTPTGFGTVRDLMSGANSREADFAQGDGELVLTYVRDSDLPGLAEIFYRTYDGASWSMPVALDLALSISSPSVIWDDNVSTLFAWIADDTGSDPRLRTSLMTGGVPGPVRRRATEGDVYSVSVDSPGGGIFYMLTQESATVLPMKMYMCRGDGEAFYPKVLLNSSSNVDKPFFAVEFGTQRVAAWWEEFDETAHPYHFVTCNFEGTGVPELSPVVEARMEIHPNPFNPATMVTFVLPVSGETRFEIFDVRGSLVRTLIDESLGVGPHRKAWDGRDNQGKSLASGVYFGKLTLPDGGVKVGKMALIR